MNKRLFGKAFGELALAFSKEIDEYQGKLYFENLKDLRNEDFAKAVKFIIQNNNFFPKIAEIRQAVQNSDGDVLEAWRKFHKEVYAYEGPHFKEKILCDCLEILGGVRVISRIELKDQGFFRRDFMKVYKILKQEEDFSQIQLPEPAEKKKIEAEIIKEKELKEVK